MEGRFSRIYTGTSITMADEDEKIDTNSHLSRFSHKVKRRTVLATMRRSSVNNGKKTKSWHFLTSLRTDVRPSWHKLRPFNSYWRRRVSISRSWALCTWKLNWRWPPLPERADTTSKAIWYRNDGQRPFGDRFSITRRFRIFCASSLVVKLSLLEPRVFVHILKQAVAWILLSLL